MKTNKLIAVLVGLCLYTPQADARKLPYQDKSKPVAERVKDLLSRMTLDEKIAELNLRPYYESSDSTTRAEIRKGRIGALLKANGAARNRSLQQEAMKHSRLGIPLIFHEDVIHGYRTIAPIPLAESCSWDTALVTRSAATAALEASASGIQLTYAPMVEISYDPRWGRIMETSGEDAFLGSAMAEARVRGFQGKSLDCTNTLAACVKHFAGYAALLSGRDYQNTDFSYRDLMERYLPPFQAAVDAGVASLMCSYTSYDGEPVTMNRFMGTELLRKRMGFKGLYMSDWVTLSHAVSEGAAADGKESARRGIESGLGMDMTSGQFSRWLAQLVNDGTIAPALIDSAAAHALELKFRMGLFDDPYAYFDLKREKQIVCSEPVRKATLDMACASMVLLKNENDVLPLAVAGKVAIVGPFANIQSDLLGAWKMMGKAEEVIPVVEGMKKRLGTDRLIEAGCPWNGVNDQYLAGIAARVAEADIIVACVGEFAMHIGEGVTTGRLEIPAEQIELLQRLKATGKPVVTVLFNGRPLVLDKVLTSSDAVLEAWYPGTMGGEAVASLLMGERTPSGKITQTFPRHVGQVPLAYNFRRTFQRINHADLPEGPQLPFGYGLSYTTFSYGKPQTDRRTYNIGDEVKVKVSVTNSGKRPGREIVQLYVRDEVATIIPREKELRGFALVDLKPGETREVEFTLPQKAFMIYNNKMEHVLEHGAFRIMTGTNSADLQETTIQFN